MKENENWVNKTKEKRAGSILHRKIDKEKFFKIFALQNGVDFSDVIFELNMMLNNDYNGYEPSYEIDDEVYYQFLYVIISLIWDVEKDMYFVY